MGGTECAGFRPLSDGCTLLGDSEDPVDDPQKPRATDSQSVTQKGLMEGTRRGFRQKPGFQRHLFGL